MAERRLTKKQLREDPFLDAVQKALAYARENVVLVVGGGIVFVLAIMLAARIGGSVTGNSGGGNPEAQRALADARSEFMMGRLDQGIAALDGVRSAHRGSAEAKEATYALGGAYFEIGDWANAQAAFEEFLRKPLYDGLMMDGAKLGIAASREESGDLPGAQSAYKELWNSGAHAGVRIQGALGAARTARAQGLRDQARRFYEGLLAEFPDSPESETARFELLELETG